jgi:alkylation response protein AidB-like acyl-CoA dehydrogenase
MQRTLFEDEHHWFRESVAAFVAREILPWREQFRADGGIPRSVWLKAGEMGFLGLGVPTEYGGSGVDDFRFNAILGEELGRAGMAYGSAIGIHTDIVAPYLTGLTSEEQRLRWLPRFCTGEMVTAIGMTEPTAGSDLQALRTSARRKGDDWIINGSKTFVTNGATADLVVVAARTSRRGISLFGVEAEMNGFARGRNLAKLGQHEAGTSELFFDDVRVPDENRIGEIDRGFGHMMDHLPQERLSSAALNLSHAAVALEATLVYVRERRAFGRPIGSFQHNRFVLAELSTAIDVARAYVDGCISAHVSGILLPIDAAKAKWWTSEVQNRVIDACLQLHGGYGYMEEYEIARSWVDARVTKIWAGSNEIMKEIIGRDLGLGDPIEPTPDGGAVIGTVQSRQPAEQRKPTPDGGAVIGTVPSRQPGEQREPKSART